MWICGPDGEMEWDEGKSERKVEAAVGGGGARRIRRGRRMSDDMMGGRGGVGTRTTSVALIVKLAELRVCA